MDELFTVSTSSGQSTPYLKDDRHTTMAFFFAACCFFCCFFHARAVQRREMLAWLGGQTLFPRIFALPRRAFLFLSVNCFVSWAWTLDSVDWEKANTCTALSPKATEGSQVWYRVYNFWTSQNGAFQAQVARRANTMRGGVMIRQCEENKSGCLTAVAAVRTRDNKRRSVLLGVWYGVRHPRLGRSTLHRWYVCIEGVLC